MLKVIQLGSYHCNIGDNAALEGIRIGFGQHFNKVDIQWSNLDMAEFREHKNSIDYCNRRFDEISKSHDVLLVGGGGLIEFSEKKSETKWKLPFNKDTLKHINSPIICHSLGVNFFRCNNDVTNEQKDAIQALIDQASLFSLRSDGSYEILDEILNLENVLETPDPAILMFKEKNDIQQAKLMAFQMALNASEDINTSRFLNIRNWNNLIKLINKLNLPIIPHTTKDYGSNLYHFNNDKMIMSKAKLKKIVRFENYKSLVSHYYNFDSIISMRGHGQMISLGMNIPGIYLSTQDKVIGFSRKANLMDYNVDIVDTNWLDQLNGNIKKLKNDENYVFNWHIARNKFMIKSQKQRFAFWERASEIIR